MIRTTTLTILTCLVTGLVPKPTIADTSIRLDFAAGILALQEATTTDESTAGDSTTATAPTETAGDGPSAEQLAKASQNPVADMISLPFQNNFTFPTGPGDNAQWVLNIQPVIPIKINDDINLITRTILPVVYAPSPAAGVSSDFGLGDLQFTAFISPSKTDGLIWGVGPVFQFPTATSDRLGTDKWSAGPSVVALTMQGPWVIGGLVQNVWSYAGSGGTDVNALLVQPFINYNLPGGWYLTTAPVLTANWKADSSNRWTIPIGGGIGKVLRIGSQPVNIQVQTFYNVERPAGVGEWNIRFQVQLLFPTR
jgi:hypothetical protein